MNLKLLNEIIACIPKERTVFRYFKGRYAFMLLNSIIGEGDTVSNIKKTEFSGLLDKPEIKSALALAGKGFITPKILNSVWPGETYNFLLTVSSWGTNSHRWDQTSRRGYNLVLQLNFSTQHDGLYNKLIKPDYEYYLNYYSHPFLELYDRDYFRETLAWSRIDIDLTTDEALIEEIQCDWLRRAKKLLSAAKFYKKQNRKLHKSWKIRGELDDIIKYCEDILSPYNKIWSEAMLAATIEFIKHEIGISKIYYHSENTGYKVKKIKFSKPPRSLYSKLPNKFCFTKTNEAPKFLCQDKYFKRIYKKVDKPEWYSMVV
ncbi:MAG: hypothetical protein ACC653_03880 [Gammaproteobacteria bacterium]